MTNHNGTVADGLALIEAAEAEAAEAEARADAAKARARAVRLRHELGNSDDPGGDESESAETEVGDAEMRAGSRRRVRRIRGRTVAVVAAALTLLALSAANGFLAWHHFEANRDRQRAAQFAAAAGRGVVNMTTLDFNKADADVARVLDGATGDFHADFASRVGDFTKVVRDSKVISTGVVNATAVDSMSRDSAVVLVTATSTLTNAAGVKQDPRKWRLNVTVSRDGDQLKMSKVEFVP